MEQGVAQKSNNFRPKRTEIIWNTRQQEVLEEIAKILNVKEAMTQTPGWFSVQTWATKNIIAKMTPAELKALDIVVEEQVRVGNDDKLKKR